MKNYYSVPFVSNSVLTWFQVSPRYCWKRMNQELVDEEKSYTTLGKQLHLYILEPEEFNKCYTYLDFKAPTSKQQLKFCEDIVVLDNSSLQNTEERLIQAYKDNYSVEKQTDAAILKTAEKLYKSNLDYIKYLQIKEDYREILSKSKQELITTITQSIKSHKKANPFFFDNNILVEAFNEIPIYWKYPITVGDGEGIDCKSLIDRLVVDHVDKKIRIIDLKTTSILGDSTDIIADRNYYRQLAFYRLAVQNSKLFPKDYEIESYIVTVNTQDPFECRVYKMSDDEYNRQLIVINDLMMKVSWHWYTGMWEYSRAYYEGDGTENLTDEYSNKSIKGNNNNGRDEIRVTDVI